MMIWPCDGAEYEDGGPGFDGEVSIAVGEAVGVTLSRVRLGPEARTWWHRHLGGQLLIVRAGSVAVVTEGEEHPVRLTAGQMLWCEPGVRHWHGAGADGAEWDSATFGTTEWGDPVTPLSTTAEAATGAERDEVG